MLTREERLRRVKLKIERANKHINDLKLLIATFCAANHDPVVVESDVQTGNEFQKFKLKTPVPDEIGLVAGDAIHNMRTALDHLIWQLVESNDVEAPREKITKFVVFGENTCSKSVKSGPVKGISPEAFAAFEAIQPYLAGSVNPNGFSVLAALEEINNFDKHRKLIITAVESGDITIPMKVRPVDEIGAPPKPTVFDFGITAGGGGVFLEKGHVLATIYPGGDNNHKVGLTLIVAFAEPEVVKHHAVVPCLVQLCQATEEVINLLGAFL